MIRMDLFGRKTKRFIADMDYERSQGYVIEVDTESKWYISLGQTIEELKENLAAKIRLRTKDRVVAYANIVFNATGNYLLLGDIVSDVENAGYGSILVRNITKIAMRLEVEEIRGELSGVDAGHFNKLEYFYRKHGYKVSFNKSRSKGGIVKQVSSRHHTT